MHAMIERDTALRVLTPHTVRAHQASIWLYDGLRVSLGQVPELGNGRKKPVFF